MADRQHDLMRVLRLDATTVAEPVEPPHLQVTLVAPDQPVEELVTMGLTNRPELSGQQALVQSTLARIRQEKMRPFLPSILAAEPRRPPRERWPADSLGGGTNDDLSNFGGRFDYDVTVLWELKELGFGNYALVRQRQAENEVAVLELSRLQDRVAAEVVKADAGVRSATIREAEAEAELKDAVDSADKNLEGLRQTRSAGNMVVLVVRPQEAVASLQALTLAYADYYGAIADYDEPSSGSITHWDIRSSRRQPPAHRDGDTTTADARHRPQALKAGAFAAHPLKSTCSAARQTAAR